MLCCIDGLYDIDVLYDIDLMYDIGNGCIVSVCCMV